MTQGKIERWHQTLKNRIFLENYCLPGDLENQIDVFVAYYNHQRYHESPGNLASVDFYFGRGQTILLERERSNDGPPNISACSIAKPPPKMTNQTRQSLLNQAAVCLKK